MIGMPVKHRVSGFLDDLGEFGLALWRRWVAFVTGSLVMALGLALYERFTKPIPNVYYVGMLFVGFLVAAFLAWKGERVGRLETEAAIADAPDLQVTSHGFYEDERILYIKNGNDIVAQSVMSMLHLRIIACGRSCSRRK